MEKLDEIIELVLEHTECPSPDELASVSRAEGACALCRMEDDVFQEHVVSVTQTSAAEVFTDPVAAQIAARANEFRILSVPARYNMFSVEVGLVIAHFMMEMGDVPYGVAVLVVPYHIMGDIVDEIEELDIDVLDTDGINVNSSGVVIWRRDVPEKLSLHLKSRRILEDHMACFPRTAASLTSLLLLPYRSGLPFSSYFSPSPIGYTSRGGSSIDDMDDAELSELARKITFDRFGLPATAPDLPGYDPERWGWICSHGRFPDIDVVEDFDAEPYRMLASAARIWHNIIPQDEQPLSFFSQDNAVDEAVNAGVDSAVEALYAGVPIDDILV